MDPNQAWSEVRWDNAVAGSFFKTLKTELVYHEDYLTKQQAELSVSEYIEGWYNKKDAIPHRATQVPDSASLLEQERLAARKIPPVNCCKSTS